MSNNQQYRFSLDKTSRKFFCPSCGKKRLVKYIDNKTKEYISDACGRCDREQKCGYHIGPKIFLDNSSYELKKSEWKCQKIHTEKSINYLPTNILESTLMHYHKNDFTSWLKDKFIHSQVDKVIDLYKIGTAKMWGGSTVFWQIDNEGNVRQGKVIKYNRTNGKRIKNFGCFFIGKKILKQKNILEPHLKQTFFGSHLLKKDDGRFVGLVESEKTAILMTLFSLNGIVSDYIYLATGGKSGCKWYETSVNSVLQDRNVVVIPDLGATEDWTKKAEYISSKSTVVIDIISKLATDEQIKQGLDIADFFVDMDLKEKSKLREKCKINVNSLDEIKLERMIKNNPALSNLIEIFDLKTDQES